MTLQASFAGLSIVIAFGIASTVVAAADDAPPVNTADAMHFGTASQPTYLSVDGRTTLLFSPLMNIVAVVTDGGAPGPGKDLDTSCAKAGVPCVILQGVTLAEPPHMGNTMAGNWEANGARFRLAGCARAYQGKCFTHLISVVGRDGAQGWYAYSLKRGVELFARKGAGGGYEEVFILTAESGVLREGAN